MYLFGSEIHLPSTEGKVQEMVVQLCERHGFRQFLSAVDRTCIAIKRPTINYSCDFINRKETVH